MPFSKASTKAANPRDCEDDYSERLQIVLSVISAWANLQEYPLLSSCKLTPASLVEDEEMSESSEQQNRILKIGSLAHLYKIEVERTTERILKDEPELQSCWFAIAQGEHVKPSQEQRLVRLLAKAYRPLRPHKYLRPAIKHGSVEHQRAR